MSWSSSSRAVVVTANAATMKRSVLASFYWEESESCDLWWSCHRDWISDKWWYQWYDRGHRRRWTWRTEAEGLVVRCRFCTVKMLTVRTFLKGGKVEWMPRAFLRFRGNKFCFRVFIFFATLNWGIRKFLTKSRYKTEIFFIDYLRLFLSKFRNLFRRNDSFLSNGDFFSFMSKMIRIRRYVHT